MEFTLAGKIFIGTLFLIFVVVQDSSGAPPQRNIGGNNGNSGVGNSNSGGGGGNSGVGNSNSGGGGGNSGVGNTNSGGNRGVGNTNSGGGGGNADAGNNNNIDIVGEEIITDEQLQGVIGGSAGAAAGSGEIAQDSGVPAKLKGANASNKIRDRYIVKLTPGRANEKANQVKDQLSRVSGSEVLRDFDFNGKMRAMALKIPEQAIQGLRHNPNIEYIEQDREIELTQEASCHKEAMDENRWFLDRLDQISLPRDQHFNTSSIYRGEGVTAYVLDTGVYTDHEEFEGRVASESLQCVYDTNAEGTATCTNGDKHGHGTHMAGSVGSARYGVAPNVKIVSVKVFNDQAKASVISIFSGLWYVYIQHQISGGPSLASLSLSDVADPDPDGSGQGSLEDSIQLLTEANVTVLVAAGNRGNIPASLMTPARSPHAITVACVDQEDKLCSFSSYGDAVNVMAPGTSILSTWNYPGGYWWLDGTSSATALVAGTVASYLGDNRQATPNQVLLWLIINGARDKGQGSLKGTTNLIAQVQRCSS